jgi:hypothetical protein
MKNIIDEKSQNIHEESLRGMIQSCFAYGGFEKDSWNYTRWILPCKDNLDEETFNRIYDEHTKYLTENFEVEQNVHTDSEGLTYNSLKQK